MQEAWERTCAYSAGVVVTKDVFRCEWKCDYAVDDANEDFHHGHVSNLSNAKWNM